MNISHLIAHCLCICITLAGDDESNMDITGMMLVEGRKQKVQQLPELT
jgi:hypothetical protein